MTPLEMDTIIELFKFQRRIQVDIEDAILNKVLPCGGLTASEIDHLTIKIKRYANRYGSHLRAIDETKETYAKRYKEFHGKEPSESRVNDALALLEKLRGGE